MTANSKPQPSIDDVERYIIEDPLHGTVYVTKHKHGMSMTNAKPSEHGSWVKEGENSFVWKPRKRLTSIMKG